MIHRISCNQLEGIRKNPLGYAQYIAGNNKKQEGGKPGVLSFWCDAAKEVHRNEKDITQAQNDFINKCINTFDQNNKKNTSKQDLLLDVFEKYCKQYDELNLKFLVSKKLINWQIHSNGILTGNTPWITEKNGEYFVFHATLSQEDWKDELKYPLIQEYLASYCFNCSVDKINVGVYSVTNNQFEFIKYSKKEIKEAKAEAKYIFTIVNNEFDKIKKNQ